MEVMDWTPLDFRSARVHARLTQAKVAAALGISQTTLSRFEVGKDNALTPAQRLEFMRLILKAQKSEGG